MKVISLPYLDHDGTLTPIIAPFLAEHSATVVIDPNDPTMILLTFEKALDANALLKLLDAPESDPVDDGDAAE